MAADSRKSGASSKLPAAALKAVPPLRQKDKFVPLLPGTASSDAAVPNIFEDLEVEDPAARGRITSYCLAERFDRAALESLLRARYKVVNNLSSVVHLYPEVVHMSTVTGPDGERGDAFFFDYGVVTLWGFSKEQEEDLLGHVVSRCQIDPLPDSEVEIDEFQYHYSAHEPPHMLNDVITINRRQGSDHQVQLAISHALAQSTKLFVYEERVVEMVLETKHLPETLAELGNVRIPRKQVAMLIGKLFLQRSEVNLLSTVLDTPEFFWSAPDSLQALYERCCEYLELETRVEVLNARFNVLGEMLDMLRSHQNEYHTSRLEWIVIWLILVEVVVGLLQLLGLFGFVGALHKP